MKDSVVCREVFGITVCKFQAEKVIFRAMVSQLNVDIFTSDHCPYCPEAVSSVNRFLNPLGEMVKVNVINDMEKARMNGVDIFPTVRIGSQRIRGVPDEHMVWDAVINEIPTL